MWVSYAMRLRFGIHLMIFLEEICVLITIKHDIKFYQQSMVTIALLGFSNTHHCFCFHMFWCKTSFLVFLVIFCKNIEKIINNFLLDNVNPIVLLNFLTNIKPYIQHYIIWLHLKKFAMYFFESEISCGFFAGKN